ncbi:MAG: hypothetical protein LBK91_02945 [Synergistaceae bacterium]|jgi:hypothetical protein|nr:hypothetical protein [Synergistaceae bacterium]
MNDTVFYVGGSKGGVGKSLISAVLVQFLIDKFSETKSVHLVETDNTNPDVGRIYAGKIPVTPVVLDESEDGWLTLFDLCEKNSDTLFVVNSAARSNFGVAKNGGIFFHSIADRSIAYDLVTFWPINRQVDCVNLLVKHLDAVRYGPVYVIRNNYWGEPKDFQIYDSMMGRGKNPDTAQPRVSGVLDFPALNDLITLQFYSYGKTIPEVAEKLNVFKRQLFLSWKAKAYAMFESTGLFGSEPEYAVIPSGDGSSGYSGSPVFQIEGSGDDG